MREGFGLPLHPASAGMPSGVRSALVVFGGGASGISSDAMCHPLSAPAEAHLTTGVDDGVFF